MKLSFICPCYNEADNIFAFAQMMLEEFPDTREYELVFVNDGSTDSTREELLKLKKASRQNIKIIDFSRNFGKEAAMFAGMENCCGDIITIIDTDLQQEAKTAHKMINILQSKSNVDCVCACQKGRRESAFSSFCKKSFYSLADKLTDTRFVDGASDFRSFRKCVKDAVLSLCEYHRFSKGIFSWVGFNTEYIRYTASKRHGGKSSFNFFKLLKYGVNGIISFTTAPLKLAAYIGSGAIFFSVIYTIITIARKLFSDINADGFTQLVILIAFLGGIQLFSIGVIGEYLAKNYIETKKRPIYIARDIIDYKKDFEL